MVFRECKLLSGSDICEMVRCRYSSVIGCGLPTQLPAPVK